MTRILGLAILALAACEGGRGLNFEKVTKLPPPRDYALGFEPDGTLLYARTSGLGEVLRWDGAAWTTHATALWFHVRSFSADRDGAPLLVHRGNVDSMTEVWRIEPDGTAVRLGAPIDEPVPHEALQGGSGTRFLCGFPAWVLRPGATVWEESLHSLWDPVRAPDGRIYAMGGEGVVRLEADDTWTLRVPCMGDVRPCSNVPFAVDLEGRIYMPAGSLLRIFDLNQDLVQLQEITIPDGLIISHVIATAEHVLLAARSDTTDLAMFALVPGERALRAVHLPSDVPAEDNLQLVVDPAGTIHAARGNWLGRLAGSQ